MKILIIHASAGAGHTKAAEAVYNRLKLSNDSASLVDVLDYTSPAYKQSYKDIYTFFVTKFSKGWGLIFYLADVPWLRPWVRTLHRMGNMVAAKSLVQFLKTEQFDYIISTHFFLNEVAAYLKRAGAIQSKIIAVITDFDVHSIWLARGIDLYVGACEFTKEKLLTMGIPLEQIAVCGIPTDAKFAESKDKDALKEKLGLKPGRFTVLVATGSFGMGPIQELVEVLEGYQVLVVCGHNVKLYEKLKSKPLPNRVIYGLVNNMPELMGVADCMITKPGGLSISEALVSRLPMIFFSPIPGQEERNVEVLAGYGIGKGTTTLEEICAEVKRLSSSSEALSTARQKISRLAKPNAVEDIKALIK